MKPRRIKGATIVKPQFQSAVNRMERLGPIWQERMGLSHFEIEHHYIDADSSVALGGSRPKNRPGLFRCRYGATGEISYTAMVDTRWNYQMADVYFFLQNLIVWDADRQEGILVHEYSHILTSMEQYLLENKLAEIAEDEAMTVTDFDLLATQYYERMEMSTENVARAIEAGWKRAK